MGNSDDRCSQQHHVINMASALESSLRMPRFAAHRLPLNGGMHGQTWAMLEIEAGPCGAWGGKRYTGMNPPTKSNLGKPVNQNMFHQQKNWKWLLLKVDPS